jgi:hypothetical protein
MNAYDHHDYRNDIERMEARNREERAAYRERLRRDLPDPEAAPRDGSWQLDFLFRFVFQLAFWTWLIWWLCGMPTIPIRWLQ